MRVGVDARFACARYDGVGRYVASLVRELALLAEGPQLSVLWPEEPDIRHPLPAPGGALSRIPGRAGRPESLWSQFRVPLMERRVAVDVWHSPFPIATLGIRPPSVVTIHDCIPERFPEYFGRLRRAAYRAAVWAALRKARLIITCSDGAAGDIERFYGVATDRIRVLPLGVDLAPPPDREAESRELADLNLEPGYVLLVGRPRPHKGHAAVVAALAAMPGPGRPRLVRVGAADARLPDGSEALAAGLGVELRVLAGISDSALVAVYRGAALVAMPSQVEGFGLPVLEAMAAGAPVIASEIQPLRATGGDVARYVAGGADAWAAAISAGLADTAWRSAARSAGPERALAFSWRSTATRTLAVYEEAAG